MKKFGKKLLALILGSALCLGMVACTSGETAQEGGNNAAPSEQKQEADKPATDNKDVKIKKIGVSMPTKDLQRWNQDGDNLKKMLEEAGFEVDLQFAANDISQQVSQVENMITNGCQVLVIATIDGKSMTTTLEKAKAENIKTIAYDRLIMDTDAVSYYATFDLRKVGALQGQYIVDKLDLEKNAGPFNIELFTGAPDDNNCVFFWGGAMDVLKPYIDAGKLVVKSGQTSKEQCSTPNWSTEEAQKRMENIISANYSDGTVLNAVLSSNDSVANGITNALAASYKGEFPILTGQDCEKPSVKNIIAGKQSMSVFKDTRLLAEKVTEMIKAMAEGNEVSVDDTTSYDNGLGIVPTCICTPVACDSSNYKELLIDSGYYTEDDLK